MNSVSRLLLVILSVTALAAAALLGYTAVRLLTADDPAGRSGSVGEASIGGPFTLVDGDGRTRTDADFRGQLMLVYFGYTFCPDVCPTELQAVAQSVDLLGPAAENVQPIFITIDPERDTPEAVKTYAESFGKTVGLTGTPEQVAKEPRSHTGRFLREVLERGTRRVEAAE